MDTKTLIRVGAICLSRGPVTVILGSLMIITMVALNKNSADSSKQKGIIEELNCKFQKVLSCM